MVCGEAMARKCQMHFTYVILFSFHGWGKTLLGEDYSHFTDKDSGPEGGWVTSLRLQSPVGSEQPRGLPQIKGTVAQTLPASGVWKRKPRKPWFCQPGSGFRGHSAIRCWARRCFHMGMMATPASALGPRGVWAPLLQAALAQPCGSSVTCRSSQVGDSCPLHSQSMGGRPR